MECSKLRNLQELQVIPLICTVRVWFCLWRWSMWGMSVLKPLFSRCCCVLINSSFAQNDDFFWNLKDWCVFFFCRCEQTSNHVRISCYIPRVISTVFPACLCLIRMTRSSCSWVACRHSDFQTHRKVMLDVYFHVSWLKVCVFLAVKRKFFPVRVAKPSKFVGRWSYRPLYNVLLTLIYQHA